jgi:hypothetical protein
MSGSFWRAAGFSYLRYANICADFVRKALKDGPLKEAAQRRTSTDVGFVTWKDGVKAQIVSLKNPYAKPQK